MRFVFILIFLVFPYLDTYGITKVYNLIDKKLVIHTNEPLSSDQKASIKRKLDKITETLDPYDSDSFVSRFNDLEKNSDVSAPDIFVDAYKVMGDFNKITKGRFNPTSFTLLSKSTKLKKLNYYLKSGVHARCTSMKNIKIKINNVFSKSQECTRISFDSIIEGITVDNIRNYLLEQGVGAFAIVFGSVVTKFNYELENSEFIKIPDYLYKKIDFSLINSYSIYLIDDKIGTYNINMKQNELALRDDLVIIVATDSNSNNNILANTLNLIDIDKLSNTSKLTQKFPLFISFEDENMVNFKYSEKFADFLLK